MSLIKSVLVAIAVSVTSCSSGARPGLVNDRYQISEITLERSGSWGIRSGYKVTLSKDGQASYVGDIHAKRRGEYRGNISVDKFEWLGESIVENDYFALKDKYHALVTDTDTVIVSVVYSGGRKRVEDFGRGGGERLIRVEQAIEYMAEQIAWTKKEG